MRSIRQSILVVSLLGMAVGVPALAQTAALSAYPPACDDSKVSKGDRDRAHTVFLSGKQFLEEANYDKAISYFKDAYSIDCSVHGILPIIASAYERKGDKREAIRALEEYQQRAPTAADHEIVERRIRNLKDQIVQEQPSATSPPSASATVAAPSASPSLEVAPSASSGAPLPPPPAEEGASYHRPGPWILAGVGLAAFAGGAVAYGVGASKVSSAENLCGSNHACPGTMAGTSAANDGNTGRTLEEVGLPVASVGLAAAVAGIIWHFVEHPQNGEKGVAASGVRVSPLMAPRAAGISFEGSLQ